MHCLPPTADYATCPVFLWQLLPVCSRVLAECVRRLSRPSGGDGSGHSFFHQSPHRSTSGSEMLSARRRRALCRIQKSHVPKYACSPLGLGSQKGRPGCYTGSAFPVEALCLECTSWCASFRALTPAAAARCTTPTTQVNAAMDDPDDIHNASNTAVFFVVFRLSWYIIVS